jgi:hypothetical protein
MKEVDEALELMKEDYKRRMDECEERRLQFELKQARLREQVLKFEKFIQENDAKRLRAELKAKHEKKLYEDKCRELQALTIKINDLEADQRELQNDLGTCSASINLCLRLHGHRLFSVVQPRKNVTETI